MLIYYFVPFIVSNRNLFWVSNGQNSVTIQNRTHVYMNFFHHKDLWNHLLQLWHKVVKHPVLAAQWAFNSGVKGIFIQQISLLNILNMLHNLSFFFSSKCRLFHNATLFGSCIIHILNTECAKI
jgi:hypothetical protein